MFLKIVENAPLYYGKTRSIRHTSPEGGFDTIGYGHKLTATDVHNNAVYEYALDELDEEAASLILLQDIQRYRTSLTRRLKKRLGISYATLPIRSQDMLLDFEFNLGDAQRKFPMFTKAVVEGDEAIYSREYRRSYADAQGVRHPLARNKLFYEWFLSDEAKTYYGQ